MRKGFRQIIVLLLLVVVTSIYLNGTRILVPTDLNSTYLSNVRYDGGNPWNQALFGEHGRWASMENYIQLANEYESRRNYGLLNDADEARYHQTFRNLARNAISDWEGFQTGVIRGKATRHLDEIPSWYAIRTSKAPPIVIMGVLAAAYTGRTLKYRLGSDSVVESRTLIHSSHFDGQYFGLSNALLGASIGSTYDATGVGVSLRKEITAGISVTYDQHNESAVGMSYSTGF